MVALLCGADLGRRDSADRIDWVGLLLLPRDDCSPLGDGSMAAVAAAPRRGFGGGRRREASSSFSRPARTKCRF